MRRPTGPSLQPFHTDSSGRLSNFELRRTRHAASLQWATSSGRLPLASKCPFRFPLVVQWPIPLRRAAMRLRNFYSITLGLFVCIGWVLAQAPADTILYNGKVVTVDKNFSVAEAVAVRGDKIA